MPAVVTLWLFGPAKKRKEDHQVGRKEEALGGGRFLRDNLPRGGGSEVAIEAAKTGVKVGSVDQETRHRPAARATEIQLLLRMLLNGRLRKQIGRRHDGAALEAGAGNGWQP